MIFLIIGIMLASILLFVFALRKDSKKTLILLISVILVFSTISLLKVMPKNYNNRKEIPESVIIEDLILLKDDNWNELSDGEKTKAICSLCSYECGYFNIPDVYFGLSSFDDDIIGRYDDRTNTVLLNEKDFEMLSSYDVIHSVSHLMYHAYEYTILDIYEKCDEEYKDILLFEEAKNFYALKDTYVCTKDEMSRYYDYSCEILARLYSDFAYESVIQYIG